MKEANLKNYILGGITFQKGKDVVMGTNHRGPGSGALERMCLQENRMRSFLRGDGSILYHDSVVIMQIYTCVIIQKILS